MITIRQLKKQARSDEKNMRRKLKIAGVKLFLLFTVCFLQDSLSAQSVSAVLDRDKILLGEQVTLRFNLNSVNHLTSFVTAWPELNDTINHIEIVKRNSIDTVTVNGLNSYEQNFTLTCFDSGKWQLGPFNFLIQDKTSGKQIKLVTPVIYLTVLPVDVSTMKDYHPIKDVIEVGTTFNWLPVIIVACVLVAAIIIYVIIKKRKKKPVSEPKIILKGTPLERAIEKLQQLKNDPLASPSEIKKFHSDIDMICRQYFEEMLHIKVMPSTNGELFARLNVYMQDMPLRYEFHQIFELNGGVKFAKYLPVEQESKSLLTAVILCLQKIDASAQQAKDNVSRMVSKY
jgi:hypothetical protein